MDPPASHQPAASVSATHLPGPHPRIAQALSSLRAAATYR